MVLVARVDFLPDDTPLGASFALPGFRFMSSGNDLFVNDTANERGIQFPDTGMRIELGSKVDRVTLRVGGFARDVIVEAKTAAGAVVDQASVASGAYQNVTLAGPDIEVVEFSGGGNEGILVEVAYDPCPA